MVSVEAFTIKEIPRLIDGHIIAWDWPHFWLVIAMIFVALFLLMVLAFHWCHRSTMIDGSPADDEPLVIDQIRELVDDAAHERMMAQQQYNQNLIDRSLRQYDVDSADDHFEDDAMSADTQLTLGAIKEEEAA